MPTSSACGRRPARFGREQGLRRCPGARRGRFHPSRARGPWPPRPERRRQVDTGQDHQRRPCPGRRLARDRRQRRGAALDDRRSGRRGRDGLPGVQPHPDAERGAERLPERRTPTRPRLHRRPEPRSAGPESSSTASGSTSTRMRTWGRCPSGHSSWWRSPRRCRERHRSSSSTSPRRRSRRPRWRRSSRPSMYSPGRASRSSTSRTICRRC